MKQQIYHIPTLLKNTPAWYIGNAIKTIGKCIKTPFKVVWKNSKLTLPLKSALLVGTIPFWLQGTAIDLAGSAVIKTQEFLLRYTANKLLLKK